MEKNEKIREIENTIARDISFTPEVDVEVEYESLRLCVYPKGNKETFGPKFSIMADIDFKTKKCNNLTFCNGASSTIDDVETMKMYICLGRVLADSWLKGRIKNAIEEMFAIEIGEEDCNE